MLLGWMEMREGRAGGSTTLYIQEWVKGDIVKMKIDRRLRRYAQIAVFHSESPPDQIAETKENVRCYANRNGASNERALLIWAVKGPPQVRPCRGHHCIDGR